MAHPQSSGIGFFMSFVYLFPKFGKSAFCIFLIKRCFHHICLRIETFERVYRCKNFRFFKSNQSFLSASGGRIYLLGVKKSGQKNFKNLVCLSVNTNFLKKIKSTLETSLLIVLSRFFFWRFQ